MTLLNDGQQRSSALRIAGIGIRFDECCIGRLLRVRDRTVKQFPALPREFIFKENFWRFCFRAFV